MGNKWLCYVLIILFFCGWKVNGQVQLRVAPLDTFLNTQKEELNVFQQWLRWNNPGDFLIRHLNQEAATLLARRTSQINNIADSMGWISRQQSVRALLDTIFGPFPPRTPQHVRLISTLHKPGYRIEKIVFESFSGVYVPGCLFIPEGKPGKLPAILNVFGHNQESFRAELYQSIIQNLVKKGMMVLAIDPIGQGEYVQHYDPGLKFSRVGYSVEEHCYSGNQCFLTGGSLAKYFIADAIRALDYLMSRPDVDADRLGMTGFSGGATVTSYVMALDERVKVAVPCSWSTASLHQLQTKGAQDAEANLFHGIKYGLSFEDLLELRAPKPTLLTFVTRDEYLSWQGAMDAYQEAQRAFTALGQPHNLQWVEDDASHWMTQKIRERMYAFFMQHFGLTGSSHEEAYTVIPEQELQITPTGQVSTYLAGQRVFDLNRDEAQRLINNLEFNRNNNTNFLTTVIIKAADVCGYKKPSNIIPQAFMNGKYTRE